MERDTGTATGSCRLGQWMQRSHAQSRLHPGKDGQGERPGLCICAEKIMRRRPHREDHIEAIAQGTSYRKPGISNAGTVGNRADRTSACLLTVPAFCCGGRETGKNIFINAAYNTQHNSDDSDRQKGYFKSRVMWYNEHRLTKYEENVIFPMIFVLQGKQ